LFQKQNELFKFLEDTENIHTRKNRVASLLWFAELHAVPAPVVYRLKSIQMDCFARLQKGYITNEKTEKQEDNWVTLEDIDDKIEEMEKVAGQKYITTIQYLMLLFHRHLPIRNDLRLAKIVSGDIPEDTSANYLVSQSSDRWLLVLNVYKTKGSYGQKIIPVPAIVGEELTKYLKIGEWFYQTKHGEPVSTQQYSNTFTSIFPDKKVGSTQVRRTIVSNLHQPQPHELEAKEELAFIMGHSVGTAQSIYAKVSS
jgi:hypothetical protein